MLPCVVIFPARVFFMVWVPDKGSILQLWADQCVIGNLSNFLIFCRDVTLDKRTSDMGKGSRNVSLHMILKSC